MIYATDSVWLYVVCTINSEGLVLKYQYFQDRNTLD